MGEFLTGWKYVVMASGECRVGDGMWIGHKRLAKGEDVVSAGFFCYDTQDGADTVKVNGYSMTLNKYPRDGDEDLIREAMKGLK